MRGPDGRHLFGTVKVGEKGQIVIPSNARKIFGINPGDELMMLGDETTGLALMKNEIFLKLAFEYLERAKEEQNDNGNKDVGAD